MKLPIKVVLKTCLAATFSKRKRESIKSSFSLNKVNGVHHRAMVWTLLWEQNHFLQAAPKDLPDIEWPFKCLPLLPWATAWFFIIQFFLLNTPCLMPLNFCCMSMSTRQVCNLFQDLWNKLLGFMEKLCEKSAKMCSKTL